jgi:hypothetical protein
MRQESAFGQANSWHVARTTSPQRCSRRPARGGHVGHPRHDLEDSNVKFRGLLITGASAALVLAPAATAFAAPSAGPNTGSCASSTAPAVTGQSQTLPDGGTIYGTPPTVPPTAGAGALAGGIQGSHGYLAVSASGTPAPPAGTLSVSGNQTESGLNGTLTVSNTGGSICIGVAGKGGVGVSGP